MKQKGFTLIELLIVIAVLGILIVAILSAIDPLEQIRKARDAGRKSDSAELLSAYERYFSTYQCYPWDSGRPNCKNIVSPSRTTPQNVNMTNIAQDSDLIVQGELKQQFANRNTVTTSQLWVSEDTNRQSRVCFEPESKTGRQGGFGTLYAARTGTSTVANCGTSAYPSSNCWVCLPQ